MIASCDPGEHGKASSDHEPFAALLSASEYSSARRKFVLFAVVAVAIVMRLPGLLRDGLWRDQANLYVQVSAPTFGSFLARVAGTEWHPPLFFLVGYAWLKLVGVSELAFTLLPFLFSIATVPIVYALGKAVASHRVGILASFLYAIAPFPIDYAEEYLYPLMGLFATLLALLVARARREALTPARWGAVAIVTLAAVYTHYTALVFVPLLILWALWPGGDRRHALRLAGALLAGALPFALWLPVLLVQRAVGLPNQWPPPALHERISYVGLTALRSMPGSPEPLAIALAAIFGIAFVTLAVRRRLDSDAGALGAIFFAMLVLTAAAGLTTPRYVVPYCELFYVFLAWIAVAFAQETGLLHSAIRPAWLTPITAVVLCVFVAFGIQTLFKPNRPPKSGIRTFAAQLTPNRQTLYLIAPDYLASTFSFYTRTTAYRGFVRWNHPEIFRLAGYAAAWNEKGAVRGTLREIEAAAAQYRELDLVLDNSARNEGKLPYGRSLTLLRDLLARYPLIGAAQYAGRVEPISVYRFELTAP
jgi:uncharacterized membrane protein